MKNIAFLYTIQFAIISFYLFNFKTKFKFKKKKKKIYITIE